MNYKYKQYYSFETPTSKHVSHNSLNEAILESQKYDHGGIGIEIEVYANVEISDGVLALTKDHNFLKSFNYDAEKIKTIINAEFQNILSKFGTSEITLIYKDGRQEKQQIFGSYPVKYRIIDNNGDLIHLFEMQANSNHYLEIDLVG